MVEFGEEEAIKLGIAVCRLIWCRGAALFGILLISKKDSPHLRQPCPLDGEHGKV
ncbi:MAG: hypothetical protein H6557_13060 [Lewinellaceae bacterium]|nr:hypothetical protein [Phaeodactylibacter sp.]MCB9037538.1 hypothetical protein [Lewinellaceae bacterium]